MTPNVRLPLPTTSKGQPMTTEPTTEIRDWDLASIAALQPSGRPIPGVVYLAGPMSGLPRFNYPAFHAAAARLRAEGRVVLSPAEHTETADSWAGWMRLGIAMLIQCDTIVLLPGWQESRGAKIEAKLAADLGMASYHYPMAPDPDWQRVTRDAGADR